MKNVGKNDSGWSQDDGEGEYKYRTQFFFQLAMLGYCLGLPNITSDNVDEWCWRLAFATKVGRISDTSAEVAEWDNSSEEGWHYRPLTRADIEECIGFSTNNSKTTRRQFIKECVKILEREIIPLR